MKKLILLMATLLVSIPALAGAPYDVTVNFNAPLTGGAPDGYNVYVDDCAATGPVGPAFGTVTPGQVFPAMLTVDGTYNICVRPFNATGELADPGQVATVVVADLPLPGPVDSIDVQVQCPNGGCTVNVTVN